MAGIQLAGVHTGNTAAPIYQLDKTITPGTKVLFDFGIAPTFGLALPSVGTTLPAGTSFANLVRGGLAATVGDWAAGASNDAFHLVTTAGGGIFAAKGSTAIVTLGTDSKIAGTVGEYLWILWSKVAPNGGGVINGLWDTNIQSAGQWVGAFPADSTDGSVVQRAWHYTCTGTAATSSLVAYENVASAGAGTSSAGQVNIPQPVSPAAQLITDGYYSTNVDYTIYRVRMDNIALAGGLTADQIVAADFAANYGRFS